MSNDNLIAFQPSESPTLFNDALTELVRKGARQIIAQAVEAELAEFLTQYQSLKDSQGRQAIVRNGYLPEGRGIKLNSTLLPPYLNRARSVEEALPWLYLEGVSTGDFSEVKISPSAWIALIAASRSASFALSWWYFRSDACQI